MPTRDVLRRVDLLAALGTGIVTMSGGEPLLHPDLDQILRHIRARGMIATVITNGYLLTARSHPASESCRARPSSNQHR